MRVGVVDIGSNSTRVLAAEVDADGVVTELDRRSTVTRLGEGVDTSGKLSDAAIGRVLAVLDGYRARLDARGTQRDVAVLTSAVRDATNGPALLEQVGERYRLDARVLSGDEEAQLTFSGATSERDPDDATPTVVVDVGGGSTEVVVGRGHEAAFHVSMQAGVVRQSERHLRDDPPTAEELDALREDVRAVLADAVPARVRAGVKQAIGVAGTATSLGAVDLGLEPYDPARVHGHRLSLERCEELADRLAALPLAARRDVPGLHPDRAATIVAGCVLLIEAVRAFSLDAVEVSEHDLLRGAALAAASGNDWPDRHP